MGKYTNDVKLNKPLDVVSMVMEDFLYHNRFRRSDWNGEMVFVKGKDGQECYFAWYYAAGIFHVEAWEKNIFGKEKKPGVGFQSEINQAIARLRSISNDAVAGGHVGSDPIHHDSDHGSNHGTFKEDTKWQDNNFTTAIESTYNPNSKGYLNDMETAKGYLAVLKVMYIFSIIFPFIAIFIIFAIKTSYNKLRISGDMRTQLNVKSNQVMLIAIIVLIVQVFLLSLGS